MSVSGLSYPTPKTLTSYMISSTQSVIPVCAATIAVAARGNGPTVTPCYTLPNQTKGSALPTNTQPGHYSVYIVNDGGRWRFDCDADSPEHALEQARDFISDSASESVDES